jgi:CRISPR-associated protein Csx17
MRSGKAYLATPLTRIAVRRNPNADLFEQLETGHFLDRLRRFGRDEQAPARIRTAVRRLEDALFDLAQKAERVTLQRVLVHLGTISLTLAKSHKGRDAVPELPMLSEDWVLKADDGSPEFRCAAALAGLGGDAPPMRPFVVPVRRDERGAWIWDTESRLAVWGEGHLAANLGRVIARRRIEATKETEDSKPFHFRAGAASSDVAAWLVGGLDETRLADLFAGLVHARIPENFAGVNEYAALPAAYAVLKPFFVPDGLLVYLELLTSERCLPLPGEIITRLQADRVQDAVELAWRRLPAAGFPLPRYPRTPPTTAGLDGPRLLAALAVPLTTGHLAHCLNLLTRLTTQSSESFQGETP